LLAPRRRLGVQRQRRLHQAAEDAVQKHGRSREYNEPALSVQTPLSVQIGYHCVCTTVYAATPTPERPDHSTAPAAAADNDDEL